MVLTKSLKTFKGLLFVGVVLSLFTVFVTSAHAQSEEELQQEFFNYGLTHSESEVNEYMTNRFLQMTVEAYWRDFNLSLISGFFQNPSQCIASKQQLCDLAFQEELLRLTAETTVLGSACLALFAVNQWASAVCIAAVAIRHKALLDAASTKKQACYLKARLECFPVAQVCIPQQQILAWCTDYNYGTCQCDGTIEKSPVIIDVLGNGFDLTDRAGGVRFDITGTGDKELISWTKAGSDDAFLVLDRNRNGTIDSGEELFGNFTPQPPPLDSRERNGFWALTGFDSNADGVINSLDSMFTSLRLWQDWNHNGVSEPGELYTLKDLGLKSIDLDYRESRKKDKHGNRFRYRAKVRDQKDAQLGRWAWDVFLLDH